MDEPVTLKAAAGPVAAVESPPARGSSPGRGAGGTFEWSPKDFETVPHSRIHRLRCREIEDALEIWLEGREAYVGGDQNVYYDEGDLDKVLAPDVFVVFGVSKRLRINYRIWVEGRPRASCSRSCLRPRGGATWWTRRRSTSAWECGSTSCSRGPTTRDASATGRSTRRFRVSDCVPACRMAAEPHGMSRSLPGPGRNVHPGSHGRLHERSPGPGRDAQVRLRGSALPRCGIG